MAKELIGKEKEIMDYFNERMFEPELKKCEENNLKDIAQSIRFTRSRMQSLPAQKMIQYFWSTIIGTDRSIKFSKVLKDNDILRFEDLIEEVRVKFNDEYFKN